LYADRDTQLENRTQAVPGANDGASGVAVLLELARVIPNDMNANIWLVFFDAEDSGSISGWDWILGSRSFVGSLDGEPDAVVIIDMVGDSDLNINIEKNSDQELAREIWGIASRLGYDEQFVPVPKYRLIDDHLPFIQAGIPAVDIIDYDYPYWHTVEDTVDKVSSESLKVVGDVLMGWLTEKYR
jgi:Zn-dependent M28 family amino/carboxypeptidase